MKKLFAALVLAGILAVPVGGYLTATSQPPLDSSPTQVATSQPPIDSPTNVADATPATSQPPIDGTTTA